MSWADEIDSAMMRGESPLSTNDILFLVRKGTARIFISGDLHASAIIWGDWAEVGHMAGKWTKPDAEWIIDRCKDFLADYGITDIEVNGRPGWKRFLKSKGLMQ